MTIATFARSARVLALTALAFSAGEALAFFDAQVLVGKRWYEFKGDDDTLGLQSQEVSVAAHLSPIPLVPVSFGALVNVGSIKKEDIDATEAAVFQAGLDIQAWVPLVPVFTPYARLTVPVYGTYAVTKEVNIDTDAADEKFARSLTLTGVQVAVGAKFSFLPLVSILMEGGIGNEKLKLDETKIDGQKVDDQESPWDTANSNSFKLGIEVSI